MTGPSRAAWQGACLDLAVMWERLGSFPNRLPWPRIACGAFLFRGFIVASAGVLISREPDQLFATFSLCKDLLRQTPQQAEDREHLRKLLKARPRTAQFNF
jgi:hypothetical protein